MIGVSRKVGVGQIGFWGPVHSVTGAEGGTRTPMDYSTRPSNVRVCQFRHLGWGRCVQRYLSPEKSLCQAHSLAIDHRSRLSLQRLDRTRDARNECSLATALDKAHRRGDLWPHAPRREMPFV